MAQFGEHDQAFFRTLAAKGKDEWNKWRRDPANKDVRVTFAGVDFTEAPNDKLNFEGFEFGDDADFSGCRWSRVILLDRPESFELGRAWFTSTSFGHRITFSGAIFGDGASFTGATFGRVTKFTNAVFGYLADFSMTTFGDGPISLERPSVMGPISLEQHLA